MAKVVHDVHQGEEQLPVQAATTERQAPTTKARSIALVATLTGANFLNTFAVQGAVIILPTIARDLSIPPGREQWVVSAYMLAFGCCLLLWGRLADLYGRRKVFILGTAWVMATTAANPFVPNEIAFDLFRGLQGLGAAANVPTAMGIIGATFPTGKARTYAISFYSAGTPLGSVCGNLVSGFLASGTSWKWMFAVIAILAAAVTMAGIIVIPRTPPAGGNAATVDWVGALLITAGFLSLLLALTEGNVVGWSRPWVPLLLVVSALLIAAFVLWQRRLERGAHDGKAPLVKISIFRNVRFSISILVLCLLFASFNSYLVFATYFYQEYQGLSALQTTMRFIPTGVTGVLMACSTPILLSYFAPDTILLGGSVAIATSSLLFALPIPPTTSYFAYGLEAMVLATAGGDTAIPCVSLIVSHAMPQEDQAMGGALLQTAMQLGRVVGLAIATATQTAVMARQGGVSVADVGRIQEGDHSSLLGLRAANWLNSALAIAASGVVAVFLRCACTRKWKTGVPSK